MFGRLLFDDDMVNFLDRISGESKIALLLLNSNNKIINEVGNFIKSEAGEIDVVSYLPKSKYSKTDRIDGFSDGIGRVKIRVGRFINRFLSESTRFSFSITDRDVEEFVNIYKSYFSKDESRLKIVSGEEILHWYLENNYFTPNQNRYGTLWNSCMRYPDRNKYMALYTKNSNIKMLIFLSEDGRLRSRALLWEKVFDSKGNEYKVMDRIYSIYDHDVNFFKEWARKNGYIHKLEQSARSERLFVQCDGKVVNLSLYMDLEEHSLRYYPYLDTFKFFDINKGRFSNSEQFNFQYILVQSNGGLVPPEPEPEPEEYAEDDGWDNNY